MFWYNTNLACSASMDYNVLLYPVFVVLCLIHVANASTVVVECPMGDIQGVKETDENTGQSYLSFKGIPYAKPPVGDLRFTKPQPHPHIDDVFDATSDDHILCPHPDDLTLGLTNFTEDCLVLNIQLNITDTPDPDLKKVIVYIHGGGFHFGTGIIHDSTSFVTSHDVIVVTINYRLGVLGFLSTENEASPGNYGLWDQTLAIKWVKDNIRAFGGDPDDITIAGESAGGSSVGFQSISPHAKGLFTKAIPQSGTASSAFALATNPQSHALTFAQFAGCLDEEEDVNSKLDVHRSSEVMRCLRALPVSAITPFMPYVDTQTRFVPCVDGDFLPDTPYTLLQNDEYLESVGFFDRRYLVSQVNNEVGVSETFVVAAKAEIMKNESLSLEERRKAVEEYDKAVRDLHIKSRIGETAAGYPEVVGAILEFYRKRLLEDDIVSQLMDDMNNLIPVMDTLKAASRRQSSSAHFLYFNYFPRFVTGPRKGVPHEADLAFWFDFDLQFVEDYVNAGIVPELFDDDDEQTKHMLSSIIAEFAKSG